MTQFLISHPSETTDVRRVGPQPIALAAAVLLVLVAGGLPPGHPTHDALGRVESGAMAAELVLSEINHHRLGPLAASIGSELPRSPSTGTPSAPRPSSITLRRSRACAVASSSVAGRA